MIVKFVITCSERYLPTGAQLRAARTRIRSDFVFARLNSFAREYLHALRRAASGLRLVRGAQAAAGLKPQGLLDNPVFQRVKGNDNQSAAGRKRLHRVGDKLIQSVQLAVDRYP